MSVPYTITETSLTVVLDCIPHVIPRTHPNFQAIVSQLTVGANDDDIRLLVDLPRAVEQFMQGNVEIRDRVVYYKGNIVNNHLAAHIARFMEANNPALVVPLMAFLDNVMENPSYRAVQGLFEWTQKANLPITQDGHLLAWKIVRSNYFDIHSGTFDNTPGKIVEVNRNWVDDNPDRTCGESGLHFCSYDYLPHYGSAADGDRIVIVKINPRDVCSFPRDTNVSKGRTCRYEVVGEVSRTRVETFFDEGEALVTDRFGPADEQNFAVGQRWKNRDGDELTITELDRACGMMSVSNDELAYDLDLDGLYEGVEDPDGFDLVELVNAQAADILPGQIEMKVGQVWETQYGDELTVIAFSWESRIYGRAFQMSGGESVWETNGDHKANTAAGEGYLHRLIRDAE